MDPRCSKETTPTSSASEESSSRLLPTVTNENWRGKNNPQERRRIQNRINQRAFRQRQRAGESSKTYKPRNSSGSSSSRRGRDDSSSAVTARSRRREEEDGQERATASASPALAAGPLPTQPASQASESSTSSATLGPPAVAEWDELGQLINRNFLSAAATNAALLGLDGDALRHGLAVPTPRPPATASIPAALRPVELQLRLAHDPILDIVPHPQLRHNVLSAIAAGQIEAVSFMRALRASGSLDTIYGPGMRSGLVVWSFPEQLASWELSEPFVRRFAFLLQGCEDLLAASNVWRRRRGEQAFTLPP